MPKRTTQPTRTRHSPEQSQLLALPPELRNMIYHQIALTTKEISIHIRGSKRATIKASHPLLSANRQIRLEFGPLLIDIGLVVAEHYTCTMSAFHFSKLSQIADSIKAGTGRKQLDLTIMLGRKPDQSLATTLQHTQTASSPFRFADVFTLRNLYVKTGFRLKSLGRGSQLETMMRMNDLALTWTEISAEHAKTEQGVATNARAAVSQLRRAFEACYYLYVVI